MDVLLSQIVWPNGAYSACSMCFRIQVKCPSSVSIEPCPVCRLLEPIDKLDTRLSSQASNTEIAVLMVTWCNGTVTVQLEPYFDTFCTLQGVLGGSVLYMDSFTDYFIPLLCEMDDGRKTRFS